MRDGGYNGYVHGVFMFIVFTAVACGGAGQVQYVSLKVCEEMSAQSNATRETYSNYSFSTSLSPEEMAIALHAPSQSLGTWTPSAAPPHRLSADQHLGNVTLNCTRPDVGATTARVLQMVIFFFYILRRIYFYNFFKKKGHANLLNMLASPHTTLDLLASTSSITVIAQHT